ncbi:Zwei Ig domain protein zig-8 [Amphibalanus amphitrite]|uniref:Zwei Ig domain protein zig-8 n=1 Tax=Amphibalanus amphitrite TaxID=1232801 RepID=A0A6A4VQS0_AMPAM|nr:Zwei Ig domain protein zig-8 [Amphibalanus amphitrite]
MGVGRGCQRWTEADRWVRRWVSGVVAAVGGGSGLAGLGVDPPVAPAGGRPWFERPQIRNVTALLGRTAYLSCTVRALGNRTVSWVRHRDIHLLTVGEFTFTNDQRFRALHSPASRLWTLQIKFVQHRDAGMYACQVSSSPPVSYPVYLSVVGESSRSVAVVPAKSMVGALLVPPRAQ